MSVISFFQRVSAPHKTKRFWIFVALGILLVLGVQLLLRFLGVPPLPMHLLIILGAVAVGAWSIAFWFVFRFGGIAFLFIGVVMVAFGILERHFS